MARYFAIGDTHGNLFRIPKEYRNSDTRLILAGDICPSYVQNFTFGRRDKLGNFEVTGPIAFWNFRKVDAQAEAQSQLKWIDTELLPHLKENHIKPEQVIWVNGNHDYLDPEKRFEWSIKKGCRSFELDGVKVGLLTGVTPIVGEWSDEIGPEEFKHRIGQLPQDIELLVAHSPAYGIMDVNLEDEHQGSWEISEALFGEWGIGDPYFTHLKAFVHGHMHKNSGMEEHRGALPLKIYNVAEQGFGFEL